MFKIIYNNDEKIISHFIEELEIYKNLMNNEYKEIMENVIKITKNGINSAKEKIKKIFNINEDLIQYDTSYLKSKPKLQKLEITYKIETYPLIQENFKYTISIYITYRKESNNIEIKGLSITEELQINTIKIQKYKYWYAIDNTNINKTIEKIKNYKNIITKLKINKNNKTISIQNN